MTVVRTKNNKFLSRAVDLYNKEKWSVPRIAGYFGVSPFRIYSSFRRAGVTRRAAAENNQLLFSAKEPSFHLKKNLSFQEKILKAIGIILYWCEGSKWDGELKVDFANSDVGLVKLFMRFLRKICGVNEEKLRGHLYCYSNQRPAALQKIWSKATGIPPKKFMKPYIRKDFKTSNSGKLSVGVFHVCYLDKKLLLQLKEWIEEYRISLLNNNLRG